MPIDRIDIAPRMRCCGAADDCAIAPAADDADAFVARAAFNILSVPVEKSGYARRAHGRCRIVARRGRRRSRDGFRRRSSGRPRRQ